MKYASRESERQRVPLPAFIFFLLSVGTRGRDENGRRRDEEEEEGMESCPWMDGGRDG